VGGSVYGNPDELDRLAAQLRHRAEVVRTSGRHHERAGQAARWVSASASAYRNTASRDRARTDAAADALDAAAAALSRHADTVRERIAMIAHAEQAVTGWLQDRWQAAQHTAAQLAGTVATGLDTAVRQFADNPWAGLPIDPARLPASGDQAWLDVHRSLAGWHG